MNHHLSLSDAEFETKFEDTSFPPTLFNHEAHLRLAWIHIKKYGTEQAIKNVCRQIINYVNKLAAEDKYNSTLTVASVKIISHFMNRSHATTFTDFILEFPQLKTNFKSLIDTHYSIDIYRSRQAKNAYIEPDLQPFIDLKY